MRVAQHFTYLVQSQSLTRWVCSCGRESAWSSGTYGVVAGEAEQHRLDMAVLRHPSGKA